MKSAHNEGGGFGKRYQYPRDFSVDRCVARRSHPPRCRQNQAGNASEGGGGGVINLRNVLPLYTGAEIEGPFGV